MTPQGNPQHRLPHLLIAGAPRCGTTSLFEWLRAHPEVCGSLPKETYFLMDRDSCMFDDAHNYHAEGIEGYARYFAHGKGRETVLLEATVGYMYQETALSVLPSLPTRPKVIFVLRSPAQRVYSTYKYFSNNKTVVDKDATFSEFLELVESRAAEIAWNEFVRDALDHSRYVEHLRRWRAALGAERMRVLLFEDLVAEPLCVVSELAEWSGIDPAFYRAYAFPRRNEAFSVKHSGLHRLARRMGDVLPERRLRGWLRGLYRRINTRDTPEKSAEDGARLRALDARFGPANADLEAEFGLELTRWRQ